MKGMTKTNEEKTEPLDAGTGRVKAPQSVVSFGRPSMMAGR
jgi:hypothetical protein